VTELVGEVIEAYLDHPDTLPTAETFAVQGWVTSKSPLLRATIEGDETAFALRPRPDVAKARPEAPHATGFFGTARATNLAGATLSLRLVFAGGSEARYFVIKPDSAEVWRLRAERRKRVYPLLRCVACRAAFPASGYQPGQECIRCEACGKTYGSKNGQFDLITDEERATLAGANPGEVSKNAYDAAALEFIRSDPDALVLDCGAGLRQVEYGNVVNLEIVPYPTTDVVASNVRLPFADGVFDGVLSLAVLEHVRDPIASAREICRVLKPGGRLLAVVPFLQPVHAFPDHYFNMTAQGLASLFETEMEILDTSVPDSGLPIWTLAWMLRSWAEGLPGAVRQEFLNLRVGDLMGEAHEYLGRDFVRALPREKNFELAATTQILGRKRR
jgi:SAM-dependent methyltransferase